MPCPQPPDRTEQDRDAWAAALTQRAPPSPRGSLAPGLWRVRIGPQRNERGQPVSLGLEVLELQSYTRGRGDFLVIRQVRPGGRVARWNLANPWVRLRPGHCIYAVNGLRSRAGQERPHSEDQREELKRRLRVVDWLDLDVMGYQQRRPLPWGAHSGADGGGEGVPPASEMCVPQDAPPCEPPAPGPAPERKLLTVQEAAQSARPIRADGGPKPPPPQRGAGVDGLSPPQSVSAAGCQAAGALAGSACAPTMWSPTKAQPLARGCPPQAPAAEVGGPPPTVTPHGDPQRTTGAGHQHGAGGPWPQHKKAPPPLPTAAPARLWQHPWMPDGWSVRPVAKLRAGTWCA